MREVGIRGKLDILYFYSTEFGQLQLVSVQLITGLGHVPRVQAQLPHTHSQVVSTGHGTFTTSNSSNVDSVRHCPGRSNGYKGVCIVFLLSNYDTESSCEIPGIGKVSSSQCIRPHPNEEQHEMLLVRQQDVRV